MNVQKGNKNLTERRHRPAIDTSSMIYGKVPPHAKEIEEAVLGALLLFGDAFDRASQYVNPETFYSEAHQIIFKAIQRLHGKSQPVDILTVGEELKSSGEFDMVGGAYGITKLTNSVTSDAHVDKHCKIIAERYLKRQMIRVAGEMLASAYEETSDAFDVLAQAEESFTELTSFISVGEMVGIDTVLVKTIQKIQEWRQLDSHITGTSSGYPSIDKATRGWQDGDLIILAARPAVGKTAFALTLARNAAKHYQDLHLQKKEPLKTVAVFSLEMDAYLLVLRMLSSESEEVLYKLQTGRIDESGMKRLFASGVQNLSALGIKFDDKPGLTMTRLRSKARKMKRQNNLGMIIIDYLQLMTPDDRRGTREQEISSISRNLKLLAQELQVPIIALSQLSRGVEQRGTKGGTGVPQLSDLRESGAIEQDADLVAFLWAPSEGEIALDRSLMTRRYFKIAKQRNGMLIKEDLEFRDEIQKFSPIGFGSAVPSSFRPIQMPKDYSEPTRRDDNIDNEETDMPF